MENKLREYAKLLIEVGLNVHKGQTGVIRCPVECAFLRACAPPPPTTSAAARS